MLPVESEDTLAGVQLTSAVDYPGKLCSTLFLGGCNFRCPFCHNGSLVLDPRGAAISFKEVLTALHWRRGLVDVVTITGGEPTLNPPRLGRLIREIKAMGYRVKLDTNGSHPEVLADCLGELDYVALDIKNAPTVYAETAGTWVDLERIAHSVALLAGRPHELRTTVVPGLHGPKEIEDIGRWIRVIDSGIGPEAAENLAREPLIHHPEPVERTYVLQPFRPGPGNLAPLYRTMPAFDKVALQALRDAAEPFFQRVILRGWAQD